MCGCVCAPEIAQTKNASDWWKVTPVQLGTDSLATVSPVSAGTGSKLATLLGSVRQANDSNRAPDTVKSTQVLGFFFFFF